MGMMHQWQHRPVSQDVTPSENKPKHRPSAMSIRYNGYVRNKSVQSTNQSTNQSINKSINQMGRGPAITTHGSLDLNQEIQIKIQIKWGGS
jgi:hypothetical protein